MSCKNCDGTGMLRGVINAETGLYEDCPICQGSGVEEKKYKFGIFIEGDKYSNKVYLDMFNNIKIAKKWLEWFKYLYKHMTKFPEDK